MTSLSCRHKQNGARRRHFSVRQELLLDADNRGFTHGDAARQFDQFFDFVHVGDNNRSQGRLRFFFQQRQIEFNYRVANFNALAFFCDTLEAFTFQFNGVDTEVNEQFDTAIGFDRERMVGFKILPMVPSTGATILLPVGLIAMPSPTIFSANTTSGTSSMLTISPESGATISIVPSLSCHQKPEISVYRTNP